MNKTGINPGIGGLEAMLNGLNSVSSNNDSVATINADKAPFVAISINSILTSSFQPRKFFSQDEIDSLARSIKHNGLINPITVRSSKESGKFEIIAGERRYRAVVMLGWPEIPAIIKVLDDKAAQAIALVENLQRENLNPIEEAAGYLELLEKYSLTHDQVAEVVGKPRSTISNFIRLIELQEPVKELVKKNSIELGHAKLLVSLSSQVQIELACKVADDKLSVRQLEMLIKKTLFKPTKTKPPRATDERFNDLALFLKRKTGGNFGIEISNSATGKIIFPDEKCYDKFFELLTKL